MTELAVIPAEKQTVQPEVTRSLIDLYLERPQSPTLHDLGISTPTEAYALAKENPGLNIQGLGDLPECQPLSRPTFAHESAADVPSKTDIDEMERLKKIFGNSRSIAHRVGYGPILYLIDVGTPNKHSYPHIPLQHPPEIHADYRRRQIRAELKRIYPSLKQDYQAWAFQKPKNDFEESVKEAEWYKDDQLQILENKKTELEPEVYQRRLNAINEHYQEAIKTFEQTRSKASQKPFTIFDKLEEYAGERKTNHPTWPSGEEAVRVPARQEAQTIAVIEEALRHVKRSVLTDSPYDQNDALNRVRQSKTDLTLEQKHVALDAIIAKHLATIPLLHDFPDYQAELTTAITTQLLTQFQENPQYYFHLDSSLSGAISDAIPPIDLILEIYDQETKEFVISDPPPTDKEIEAQFMYTLTPTSYGTHDDNALQGYFEDFVYWKHRHEPGRAEKILKSSESFRSLCEKGRHENTKFVGNDKLERNWMNDGELDTPNFQIINPSLPSPEALEEIRNRKESRPTSVEPAFQDEWRLAENVLKSLGVNPHEWYWWTKSLKRLGLGGRAARYRANQMVEAIDPARFSSGTGSFPPTAHEHRFPTKEEIKEKILAFRRGDRYVGRNTGFDTYNNLILAWRLDVENHLHKYDFTPEEALDHAAVAYKAMKVDYFQGRHPDSQIAYLRTSLMSVIAGQHEQWYKHAHYSLSAGEARLDELDALLFLPSIAEENNYDPGVFLTGVKLVLQMDQGLRRQYAPVIKEALKRVIAGNFQLEIAKDMTQHGHTSINFTLHSEFKVNASHLEERRPEQDEVAVSLARTEPDPRLKYGGHNLIAITRLYPSKDGQENHHDTQILMFLTAEQYSKALAIVKAKHPEISSTLERASYHEIDGYQSKTQEVFKDAVGQVIGRPLGAVFAPTGRRNADGEEEKQLVEKIGIDFMAIDPLNKWVSFDQKPYRGSDQTYANDPNELKHMVENAYSVFVTPNTWTDPDVEIDHETRLLVPKDKERFDLVASGSSSTMERLALSNEVLAHHVDRLAEKAENTELAPLHSTTHIIEMLIGNTLPHENLPTMMGWLNYIEQIGAKMRGLKPEEKQKLLDSLDLPFDVDHLNQEGFIQTVWLASGQLERETVARNIITATAAAFRISVHRIMEKLRAHEAGNLALELETTLDISNDEASKMALEAIARSANNAHDDVAEKTEVLFSSSDPDANPTKAYRTYLKDIGGHVATLLDLVAKHTDYHYASTHWLQMMDQIAGDDFINSEGRINLYCVQASYLLYELIMDTLQPMTEFAWHSPLEASIALEDEGHGQSVKDFLRNVFLKNFTNEDDDGQGYTHYFVFLKLPKKEAADKQYFMLVDQTVGSIKLFSDEAIVSSSKEAVVIDNNLARELSAKDGLSRPANKQTRILLAQNQGDQSLSMVGHLLERSSFLEDYGEQLEGFHPRSLLQSALKPKNDLSLRKSSLQKLIAQHPYFIGIEGLSSPSDHFLDLTKLQTLCQEASLPLVGLFISHIQMFSIATTQSMTNQPEYPEIQKRSDSFLELAALLPEAEWQTQKTMYAHIVLPEDQEKIKKRRLELQNESELKRRLLAKKTNTALAGSIDTAAESALESSLLEDLVKQEEGQKFSEEPGSPERLHTSMRKADINATILDVKQSLQAPMLPENTLEINHTQTGMMVKAQQPLEINKESALQAALLLLENQKTEKDLASILLRVSAYWRAFVKESRNEDARFATTTWEALNLSIAAAAKKLELRLPILDPTTPSLPLGSAQKILKVPARIIQNAISQTELPKIPASTNEPRPPFLR